MRLRVKKRGAFGIKRIPFDGKIEKIEKKEALILYLKGPDGVGIVSFSAKEIDILKDKICEKIVPPIVAAVESTPEKVEVKDVPKVEVKDVPKVEVKDVPKVEVKDVPKVEVKELPKGEPNVELLQDELKNEVSKVEKKKESKIKKKVKKASVKKKKKAKKKK
jgi:hypothetical protein